MQCINSTMLSRSIYLHISVQGPQTLIKWVTLLIAQTVHIVYTRNWWLSQHFDCIDPVWALNCIFNMCIEGEEE